MYEQINKIEKEIGLDELKAMFEGKPVRIINTNPMIIGVEDICEEISIKDNSKNIFKILLKNKVGYLIKPNVIGDNFVEGTLPDETKGNRRIEVIN